jgi:membrane-associated protease RseP (regulator of RpoE activity)
MNVMIYDLILLAIFVIFIGIFLYRKRKNLKKEGLLLLYKTTWGIRFITRVGEKFSKTFSVLSYFVVGLGYLLMGTIVYLFGKIVWIYVLNPEIVKAIKIPPIMPLVPYLPQVFKLDFLPPFYFTYWIIIIAIVAIVHEFAHGIFAAHTKVGIKKTGFGFFPFFLPVFLAAFVELDEKKMQTKKIFSQMSVLAAGTFANILTAILFFGVMWLFFVLSFSPAGVTFDSYTYSEVDIETISMVNGIQLENSTYSAILYAVNQTGLNSIKGETKNYLITYEMLTGKTNLFLSIDENKLILYDDAPAINANLEGIITQIEGIEVNSREEIGEELLKYSPGDEVTITTIVDDETKENVLILGTHPINENLAYVGIGFTNQEASGLMGKIVAGLSLKKPNIHYEPKFGACMFIYYLLWWLVLVSFSIALVNMLPVGIFDGGRFFYLTILAITKKEKVAKKAFSIITYLFLLLLFVIMAFWLKSFF